MREEDFEEAAERIAQEMSERKPLMKCYRIPSEIIYESMQA